MTAENVGPTMDEIRVCVCHTNLLIFLRFYRASAHCTRDVDIAILSARLSVRDVPALGLDENG